VTRSGASLRPVTHLEACIVGAGPRGLSVLERLCAQERAEPSHDTVTVHVVDPAPAGAGSVWRTDQSRQLLTNTVASQITVYTDASARISGPLEPGPSLYDWARRLASAAPPGDEEEQIVAEARRLGPDSYPSRAFYGRYLHACFQRVVAGAPAHVEVRVHRSRAVALADTTGVPGGPQGIRLADGTRLHDLDAVVLALGHGPVRPTRREAKTASLARVHHLTYLPPANPADLDLDLEAVRPGEPVLLRGLGLNFFDHMALFTAGRGGTFVREDGRLVYRPSGREPTLYATSRRGIPYHARGENEKGPSGRYLPRLLTPETVRELRRLTSTGGPKAFTRYVWPLIAVEVESVYYGALLAARGRPAEREEFVRRYLGAAEPDDRARVLDDHGIAPADRWDWDLLARPYRDERFADRAAFRRWLLDHLARDLREARSGNVSGPLKAALDVLRDLRNEIRLVVDHAGLDGDSHREELDGWYTPFNAFLSIGPPALRIEELMALVEAGVVELIGPGTTIHLDPQAPAFVAVSDVVPGPPVRSRMLIEARLPEPDLRRTADPLLQHLVDTDQCRPHRIGALSGMSYVTGGLAVTERPYRVLDAQGRPHPRRFAYGIPTEAVHWVTAAGIRPGVGSVTLEDSDAIAQAVRGLPPVDRATAPLDARPAGDGAGGSLGVVV
jgi:hypothetical protein